MSNGGSDLKINMKTNVFTYFLINASSPAIPNNTAPSIPYAEILINNYIINIIPPDNPTIQTVDARLAEIPKACIFHSSNADNITANTPPIKLSLG